MEPDQTDALVVVLRRSAREMVAQRSIADLEATLGQIVAAAVDTVPGADAGGISMTEGGQVDSRVPTREDVRKLDDLQSRLNEGPCMTALADPPDDGVVHARDLSGPDGERWPHFAPQAVAQGYRSLLSTQLSAGAGFRAALNLYSHEADAFDDASRTTAGLFGVQAALLIYGADHAANLEQALGTRDVIGQAKGILMERFDVDDDRAFQMLVRSSQETNVKLVDVARWLSSPAGRRRGEVPPSTR
ncbi:GAF and ANTAR domain-containing protein [Pseudonocardia sp. KRD291]|uniref:GAF and ANTAR domain-containing protein n=1 Tax=Pseudonocardia sp. KRD291 TaxID=2792007 RepID=UPI001C4A1073|nr:GAF and ANTAR domain-containing protein [Pseudonocardia sp. KRD291]MBW0102719.1 GAF and ANTAR domain-containing protein [Pseudonocardia sp. KRD291]